MQIVFSRDSGTVQPEELRKNYLSVEQAAAGVNKWAQEGWWAEKVVHGAGSRSRVCLQDVLQYANYLADPEGFLAIPAELQEA